MNWSEEKLQELRVLYDKYPKSEIHKIMGLTEGQVRSACYKYKISWKKRANIWEDWQIDLLKKTYFEGATTEDLKIADMCKLLGKPEITASRKARELGLTNAKRNKKKDPAYKRDNRLFKNDKDRSAYRSERMKKWYSENEHPRGFLGGKHSEEAKQIISEANKKYMNSLTAEQKMDIKVRCAKTRIANGTQYPQRINASWKAAWHEIGGKRKFFRSRWEANYARYLEWLKVQGEIIEWLHEPETFWFEGVKRGCVSYLPDFKVTEKDGSITYHEVKGWMDDRSKTKIKRMAKYHPNVKLIVIDSKCYRDLQKSVCNLVPDWDYCAKT